MSQTILRLPQVISCTGLSRSAIYRAIDEGSFPLPRRISTRAVGWLESEVLSWIDQRPNTKPPKPARKR